MKTTELAAPEEWPDPDELAIEYHERAEEGGYGVALDSLVEAKIMAEDHAHRLHEVYIHLDAIADDGGMCARMLDESCKMHKHAEQMAGWFEEFADALAYERRRHRTDCYGDER